MGVVAVSSQDGIVWIEMNDPAKRNALSLPMLDEMTAAFDSLASDTRVVVLRAALGSKVWCAGFDIGSLEPGLDPLSPQGPLQRLFSRLSACSAPVIGMVHGSAWGGGADLALRCDILIGDTTSQFAFTPGRLGLPYNAEGLLNVMLRTGSAVAMEMFATAEPIAAERALAVGILNHLIPPDELEAFTAALARKISANAPLSVSSAKRHLRAFTGALALPPKVTRELGESRTRALDSDDYVEGLSAFAEKRKPIFTGR